MKKEQNIKKITATDIEKYLKGQMSPKDRNVLERTALDDPFLAEAIEGFSHASTKIFGDLSELQQRLQHRVAGARIIRLFGKGFSLSALRVAAMLILFAGAGLLVYQFMPKKGNKELVKLEPASKENTVGQEQPVNINSANKPVNQDKPAPINIIGEKTVVQPTGKGTTEQKPNLVPSNIHDESAVPVTGSAKTDADDKPGTVQPAIVSADNKKELDEVAHLESGDSIERAGGNSDRAIVSERSRKKQEAASPKITRNQFYTFKGRVTDQANTGLAFVKIVNMDDQVGTYTDANGYFTLTSSDTVLQVQVRSFGFENSVARLNQSKKFNSVVLQQDAVALSEVVISNRRPNASARASSDNRSLIEPEPADGWEKYDSYLANNLNIPDDFTPSKNNESPAVVLSFEVDKNGEAINIRVEKSLCASCDKEAIRLIKDGPGWKTAAKKKGRTTVTINF